jgi:hypothetical protein
LALGVIADGVVHAPENIANGVRQAPGAVADGIEQTPVVIENGVRTTGSVIAATPGVNFMNILDGFHNGVAK